MVAQRALRLILYLGAALTFSAAADAYGAPWPEYVDDPAVRQMFFDEYPNAYERLRDAVRRARGVASVTRRDAGSETERYLHFMNYDGNLVIRLSRSQTDPGVKDHAALVTPMQSALVRAPLTDAATPVALDRESDRRLKVFVWQNSGFLVESTFAVSAMRIQPRLDSGDWKYIRGRRDPSDPELIAIHFSFVSSDEFWGSLPPRGTIDVLFDRRADWAVRRYRMHSVPYNLISEGEVETTRVPNLGVVPKRVSMEDYETAPSSLPPQDPTLLEATQCTFSSVRPLTEFPAEEFTLRALGVTGTLSRTRWKLLIFGNLLFIGLIIAAFIVVKRRRRRQRA